VTSARELLARACFVVNPMSGAGRGARRWADLHARLRAAGIDPQIVHTTGVGSGRALARDAANSGAPLVVAVGGDGTVNEVVDGLAEIPDSIVGMLLTGRGRDAVRNLSLPSDPDRAVAGLLDGAVTSFDLGLVRPATGAPRHFVNAAGVGFDATVAARAAAIPGRGAVPYVAGIVLSLARHRPIDAEITIDGRRVTTGPITLVAVANGAWYGGGMMIAPGARPDDGALDVVVIGALSRRELLTWLPTIFRGTHLRHPAVSMYRATRVEIRAATPLPAHVDGELAGTTPLFAEIRPRALRLLR
jgi:diacylglycerol kinase (ATP)